MRRRDSFNWPPERRSRGRCWRARSRRRCRSLVFSEPAGLPSMTKGSMFSVAVSASSAMWKGRTFWSRSVGRMETTPRLPALAAELAAL